MNEVRPHWMRRGHLFLLDGAVAVLLTIIYLGFVGQASSDGVPHFTGPVLWGWLVAAGVGLPIVIRRTWPIPVLASVLAFSVAATLMDITREPYAAVGLALYLVALKEPTGRSVPALAVSLAVSATAVLLGEAVVTPAGSRVDAAGTAILVWMVLCLAWTAGVLVRLRRIRAAEQTQQREESTLIGERLRIARELHDIVSHSLSMITVKAGVAEHIAELRPEEARAALRDIEQTGREALVEMRYALGVLRSTPIEERTDTGPSQSTTAFPPMPGLTDLPQLVEGVQRAGLRVILQIRAPGELSPGVGLTVYRIVQESLTNAIKHAGPATRCRVTIDLDVNRWVWVEVSDEGAGPYPARDRINMPGGHGLAGMRERVAAYGGSLTAEPGPEGGFTVTARLPTAAGRPADTVRETATS